VEDNIVFRDTEGRDEFLFRTDVYLKEGLSDRAVALAQDRLERFPGDVDARIIAGYSLVRMEKIEEALEFLKSVEDDILKWSRVFEHLGDIYLKKGLIEKAAKAYRRFVSLNSGLPIEKGVSAKLGSLVGALDGDLLPDPENVGISDNVSSDLYTITLAELYIKQGHLEMAREVLKEILRSDPGDIRAAEMLKDVETTLKGRESRALSDGKRILVIDELNRWLENLKGMKRDTNSPWSPI
jgi:tetratricopeptide (TPR) repeat protein